MPILFGFVAWLDTRATISEMVLWGLTLWGLLHLLGGLIPVTDDRVLYNLWLLPFVRFDHLVHAVGFGFAGLAVWEVARPAVDTQRMSGAMIIVLGGAGIGGLNEMIEFLITLVASDTNIGGFENTGWDLVANLVGASAAATWVRWRWKRDLQGRGGVASADG